MMCTCSPGLTDPSTAGWQWLVGQRCPLGELAHTFPCCYRGLQGRPGYSHCHCDSLQKIIINSCCLHNAPKMNTELLTRGYGLFSTSEVNTELLMRICGVQGEGEGGRGGYHKQYCFLVIAQDKGCLKFSPCLST